MISQLGKIGELCLTISKISPALSFTIFEIGSRPVDGDSEPFHNLLDFFPESNIVSFEVDGDLCNKLNKTTASNIKHFPVALGITQATLPFYETIHPMCSSLFKPNEELLMRYNNLEVAMLKKQSNIETISLDRFVETNQITDADFVKIDVQGAELDIFKGGITTLKKCTFIVSEVEFIPLYIDQPLFGDVCSFFKGQNFMFHKFLTLEGRALKPITMNNDPNYASQHMWADAVFIRHIDQIDKLASAKLLKMGLLAYMYGSLDVAYNCLQKFDLRKNTTLSQEMLDLSKA